MQDYIVLYIALLKPVWTTNKSQEAKLIYSYIFDFEYIFFHTAVAYQVHSYHINVSNMYLLYAQLPNFSG